MDTALTRSRDADAVCHPMWVTVPPTSYLATTRAGPRRPVTDMRLALLRHWTLYEALLYANYVAVRMHTYNDAGRVKLEDLLVNMGVPLAQSKHSYSAPAVPDRSCIVL